MSLTFFGNMFWPQSCREYINYGIVQIVVMFTACVHYASVSLNCNIHYNYIYSWYIYIYRQAGIHNILRLPFLSSQTQCLLFYSVGQSQQQLALCHSQGHQHHTGPESTCILTCTVYIAHNKTQTVNFRLLYFFSGFHLYCF